MHSENPSDSAATWRRDLALLTLAFGVLFLWQLGTAPLANPDAGRYAEIPREMLATGDWVTPRLNGVNYFEKPPLMYWALAASQKFFGASEWAVRAPLAVFGLFGVLLTYAAGRQLYGRAAGVWSAIVLGTSLLYFALTRVLVLDLAVSVLMSATLFCFILAVRAPAGATRRWLFYGLYASAALATLTKGLIGFLVTGAVMFLWLLLFHQWRRLRPMHLPTGALLFLAIAAPWHILAAQHNETWAHRYFVYEHFERFLTSAASRPGPIWYFVPIVLLGLFPWMGFLWSATREALAGGWARRKENADAWFLITWAAFVFFFFSISKSKLAPYILPIFPALAVLIGAWIARREAEGATGRLRIGFGLYSFVCGLLGVALIAAVNRPALVKLPLEQAEALRLPAYLMAATLLLGGIFAPWFNRVRGIRWGLGALAISVALFYGTLTGAMGDIQRPGTKELAAIVKAQAKSGDRVLHYHEFFHDFTYYAERVVDIVAFKGELELEEDAAAQASGRFIGEPEFRAAWTGPAKLWVVARKKDLGELFADPTFHYRLIAESRDHTLFTNQP